MAVQMAASLFESKTEKYSNVHILQIINLQYSKSGQYIVKGILDIIDRIYMVNPTCNVHIEWVPGHQNIDGNERADQAAKTAASPNNTSPSIRMRSPQKRAIQTEMKTQWDVEWKTGKNTAKRLRHMSQQPGATTGFKLYGCMQKREHVVWISRLRTEYLNRFKIIETAECECGAERETVEHYLLKC